MPRTPGDWHFTHLPAGDIGVVADGRGLILNVTSAMRSITGGMTPDEVESNARLIGACTELLVVLRHLEAAISETLDAHRITGATNNLYNLAATARAMIQKATFERSPS